MIRYLAVILSFNLFPLASGAHDYELTHSMRCVKFFTPFEHKYKIPRDTLHSISLQESGRLHTIKKIKIPWPWTVNVEGKGYYFDTKLEAVQFVRRELAMGKKSIDVGCMQVNLKQHPKAFRSVEEAFDPKANINYGASFLRSKYEQVGNWHKAIAHYHSATPEHGIPYKNSVINIARNMARHKATFMQEESFIDRPKVNKLGLSKVHRAKTHSPDKRRRYRSDMMIYVPSAKGS